MLKTPPAVGSWYLVRSLYGRKTERLTRVRLAQGIGAPQQFPEKSGRMETPAHT
jgi:hypothetical protein